MCTIGSVFDPELRAVVSFKQCDLAEPTRFFVPEVHAGPHRIRYLAFERRGSGGPWAGVNDHGLALVTADAYLDPETNEPPEREAGDVFAAYTRVLSACASAREAANAMAAFYEHAGPPDILLVADPHEALLLEHAPGQPVRMLGREAGFFVATNHFRAAPGAILYQDNPSTYLRLARAEAILGAAPTLVGVQQVLADQAFGPSDRSICRVASGPGERSTRRPARGDS